MAYQYKGNVFDVEETKPRTKKKYSSFNPDACGTYAGYRRHQKHGIPFCDPCRDAQRAYDRDYTERCRDKGRLTLRGFNPEKCGTVAGHAQHYRYGSERCDPCRQAHAAYLRDWKKRRK